MHAHEIQPLLEKLKTLSPERVAEVEDFIDFLRSRALTRGSVNHQNIQPDFPVISIGQWPKNISLNREDMYDDNRI